MTREPSHDDALAAIADYEMLHEAAVHELEVARAGHQLAKGKAKLKGLSVQALTKHPDVVAARERETRAFKWLQELEANAPDA